MKILLTGFDPFGGETVNPAFEAVKLLPDTIAGAEIVKQEVPTEFIRAGEVLEAAIQANQPDVVICIGQAGGRSAITPEKVAINLMDGRIADNAGYQPIDVTIQEDGETAYFTSLPVKAMVQSIKDAGIPSALSYTAGSYVCNYLMYTLLYLIHKKAPAMRMHSGCLEGLCGGAQWVVPMSTARSASFFTTASTAFSRPRAIWCRSMLGVPRGLLTTCSMA